MLKIQDVMFSNSAKILLSNAIEIAIFTQKQGKDLWHIKETLACLIQLLEPTTMQEFVLDLGLVWIKSNFHCIFPWFETLNMIKVIRSWSRPLLQVFFL
jgi:hypothetical protein